MNKIIGLNLRNTSRKIGKYTIFFLLCVILGVFSLKSSYANEVRPRIISLKPNITEILFELGLEDQIIGVTSYCDYPVRAKKIKKVADFISVNVEEVMVLKPDLIIGSKQNSNKKQIEFLRSLGFKVYLFDFYRLDAVFQSIKKIGELTNRKNQAIKIVNQMNRKLKNLRKLIQKPKKTLIVISSRPFYVAGHQNELSDLLDFFEIPNVAKNLNARYPQVSIEQMISLAPEVIIDMDMGNENTYQERLVFYKKFSSIPAVKNDEIYNLDISLFRPSTRIVDGAVKLTEIYQN
jgi:iron complex transport system substrate-binding protein